MDDEWYRPLRSGSIGGMRCFDRDDRAFYWSMEGGRWFGTPPSQLLAKRLESYFCLEGAGALASDFSKDLVMREKMSTGTGKTTVVFFSTPISVNVCR
jgi:hypothetical protein